MQELGLMVLQIDVEGIRRELAKLSLDQLGFWLNELNYSGDVLQDTAFAGDTGDRATLILMWEITTMIKAQTPPELIIPSI
jgi:hypothetical protein